MTGLNELTEEYQQQGIRFRYPAEWSLEEQAGEEEFVVSLQSPETAFWLLTLYFEKPVSDLLVQSAIEAYQEEYPNVDVFKSEMKVGEHQGAAADLEFLCLDLVNRASVRTFVTDRFTAVVLSQFSEEENAETEQILEQITQTVRCEEDLSGFPEE